jgi:2-oxoisovalerate dehydrogenase E2 component (dihydrolipoyl transacylase)
MGRYVFKLPDVGEGTAEAEIVAWHVSIGDHVQEDQNLVDVMTDKATVEMTSPVSGVVVSLAGAPGEMAAVGAPLVELEVEGAGNAPANGHAAASKAAQPVATPPLPSPSPPTPKTPLASKGGAVAPASSAVQGEGIAKSAKSSPTSSLPAIPAFAGTTRAAGTKPLASPSVRARADELGIKLQFVAGTGPAGRISHADLDAFVTSGGAASSLRGGYTQRDGVEDIKVIGLRRKIAEKMQPSSRNSPCCRS